MSNLITLCLLKLFLGDVHVLLEIKVSISLSYGRRQHTMPTDEYRIFPCRSDIYIFYIYIARDIAVFQDSLRQINRQWEAPDSLPGAAAHFSHQIWNFEEKNYVTRGKQIIHFFRFLWLILEPFNQNTCYVTWCNLKSMSSFIAWRRKQFRALTSVLGLLHYTWVGNCGFWGEAYALITHRPIAKPITWCEYVK